MDELNELEMYEKKCEEIRRTNDSLLELFEKDMEGLSPKTIRRHLSNVDFYINEFLLYADALPMEYGLGKIDEFLGEFFIRKCMWSTPATIKSTAASIKKFYKCMLDHGKIEKGDYKFFCETVKVGMEVWQALCAQYNDPEEENPFGFFW
ncbi:MAG TPA: hypothetical protein IAA03_11320 [Candidatus Ruminococcus avistercoris]|nr:hypothetical protein [Candidatus Ruminococcus avistercoris]